MTTTKNDYRGLWHICSCGNRFKLLYVVTKCRKCGRTYNAWWPAS